MLRHSHILLVFATVLIFCAGIAVGRMTDAPSGRQAYAGHTNQFAE